MAGRGASNLRLGTIGGGNNHDAPPRHTARIYFRNRRLGRSGLLTVARAGAVSRGVGDEGGSPESVRVYVVYLRKKLERAAAKPRLY